MNKIFKCLYFILIIGVIWFYGCATIKDNYNFLLIATLLMWFNIILYSCEKFKERALLFFFSVTFFVFLLGRPVIQLFQGIDWADYVTKYYSIYANVWLGVELMLLSLTCIWFGAILGDLICKKVKFGSGKEMNYKSSFFAYNLRWISLVLFGVSLFFSMIMGMEKIKFILQYSYAEYFALFKSQNPYVFFVLSTFLPYSLSLYLATHPRKSKAYIVLFFYVASTIPTLILGERNPFALSIVFSMIYFLFRDYSVDSVKWFGKFEKTVLLFATPIGLAMLGLLNYTRDNITVKFSGIGETILDLIIRQGVSFSWLSCGLGVLDKLPLHSGINYTFGGIIDYFQYGKIGQTFLGISGLGSGNSILKATEGNSMAHHLSYVLMGDLYLEGHGCGSSYILEVYADYGYIGIIIFSTLLGVFLNIALKVAKKGIAPCAVVLLSIPGILLMPRAEALGGFNFALQLPFWCAVCSCMFGAALFYRKYKRYFIKRIQISSTGFNI